MLLTNRRTTTYVSVSIVSLLFIILYRAGPNASYYSHTWLSQKTQPLTSKTELSSPSTLPSASVNLSTTPQSGYNEKSAWEPGLSTDETPFGDIAFSPDLHPLTPGEISKAVSSSTEIEAATNESSSTDIKDALHAEPSSNPKQLSSDPSLVIPDTASDQFSSTPSSIPSLQTPPSMTTHLPESSYSSEKNDISGDTAPPSVFSSVPTTHSPLGQYPLLNDTYSRVLVMGHKKNDDVSWVHDNLPDLDKMFYVVDDPNAENTVPANKGHEAMVYLTYIIDHYAHLPDILLFFHPHREAWHNNILLDLDTATTIGRLSSARVVRLGYLNTRCHLDPGCPSWLRLDAPESEWNVDLHKEQPFFTAELWKDLHPGAPLPTYVSGPCCAQFAVSAERVREKPVEEYVRLRNWVLHTTLDDEVSGRIMEYTWQYIFTGEFEVCPSQHECYCDGYGICFPGGDEGLNDWLGLRGDWEEAEKKLQEVTEEVGNEEDERVVEARRKKDSFQEAVDQTKQWAFERGDELRRRAVEEGRGWIS
ncbi:MAG: hypothetical protein Q9227_002972 [Pyrenula ochraceoflavens]